MGHGEKSWPGVRTYFTHSSLGCRFCLIKMKAKMESKTRGDVFGEVNFFLFQVVGRVDSILLGPEIMG